MGVSDPDCISVDPLQGWFSALAVMALVVFIPGMVVPMVGSIMSSVSSIATGAVASGSLMTGMAGMGAMRGVGGAMSGMAQQASMAGQSMNPLQLAKHAFLTEPGLGAMGKSALIGAGHGLGGAATQSMGMMSRAMHGPSIHGLSSGIGTHGGADHPEGFAEATTVEFGKTAMMDNLSKDVMHNIDAQIIQSVPDVRVPMSIDRNPLVIENVRYNAVDDKLWNSMDNIHQTKIINHLDNTMKVHPDAVNNAFMQNLTQNNKSNNGSALSY